MEVKLVVPESLEEVTLGQYQQFLLATDGIDDDLEISKSLIEAFCGIERKVVDSIPLKDAESLLEVITGGFSKEHDLQLRFNLLDVDMGFIPKMDDISLGEFIDVENFIDDWQKMHRAMAVLYRPVNFKKGDKYTIAPYEPSDEASELMKEMPLSVAMGAMVFFYRLGMELSTATLNYIKGRLKKDITSQAKTALEKSGDGINQYIHSLREMSDDLMKLPNYSSTSV